MTKIVLDDVTTAVNQAGVINSNFTKIEETINDDLLSRDGVGTDSNQMEEQLDMNSQKLFNLPNPISPSDAATKSYVDNVVAPDTTPGIVTSVETQSAILNQTIFTLQTTSYIPGSNNLDVYVNGNHLNPGAYSETSSTVVTLGTISSAGDSIFFKINQRIVNTDLTNAENVAYTPAGTSAVTTTVDTKLDHMVLVTDFGATADGDGAGGGTDNTLAIQAAFDYLVTQGGGQLVFPQGTYLMDSQVTVTASVSISIFGQNSIIDHTNAPSSAFVFSGTRSTASTLTNDVMQLDQTFDTPLSLVKGDLVTLIQDNFPEPAANLTLSASTANTAVTITADASVFTSNDIGKTINERSVGSGSIFITGFTSGTVINGFTGETNFSTTTPSSGAWAIGTLAIWSRGTYYRGEFHKIEVVSGNTMTTASPFLDEYTPASEVNVYKVSPMQLTVNDLTIIADVDAFGFKVDFGENIYFENVHIKGFRVACFDVSECYNTTFASCTAEEAFLSPGIGLNYGISIDSCQNLSVNGGSYITGRHGITIGGLHRVYNVYISDCTIGGSNDANWGFDTHGNSEYVALDNCNLLNGATLSGWNFSMENCRVFIGDNNLSRVLNIDLSPGFGSYFRISNCFFDVPNSVTASAVIRVDSNFKDARLSQFEVSNCHIVARNTTGILFNPPANYDAGSQIDNIILKDNHIAATDSAIVLFPFNSRSLKVNNFEISGYASTTGSGGLSIRIQPEDATFKIGHVDIHDLTLETTTSTTSNITVSFTDYLKLSNCNLDGGGTNSSISLNSTNTNVNNCIFSNYTANGGLISASAVNTIINNNDHTASAGTPSITDAFPIISVSPNGLRHVEGAAAPTTLTWRRGERVVDTTPTASGTEGWTCTESGTFSAATDSTGDTDGSTAVITGMTDTSDFSVGNYVDVSGGFATTGPFRVLALTSTTMTLDTNSNGVSANVTVDTSDPVFKTFGVIGS